MPAKFLVSLIVGLSVFAAGSAMAADPAAGKKIFVQCSVCHSVVKGKNLLGPSLYGVVGRKSGTAEGFKNYSPAMKNANIAWTEDNLDQYLANPKALVPGNRMIFLGLKKAEDRANVIAYLKQAAQE